MRSSTLKAELVLKGTLAILLAQVGLAHADAAPAAKWYDTIGLSGYLQGSYLQNLNDPASKKNGGRQFDTDSNTFNLNTFLLQIAKPVGDTDHYGFTVRLRTGKDASALNGTGNSTGSVAVQEAYMTYVIPTLTKLSVIGGKFVTPEGFEGVDTVNNPNFSEGLLFTYVEPISHTGIKANYVFSDKVNATVGLVNGWDLTSDNNDAKTILWQVATTPTKQLTWSFQGLYGEEEGTTRSERLSLDTVLGFAVNDKLSLTAQGNWGDETNAPTTGGTTHWSGLGFWASYATTSKFTETARFEVVSDQNGAGRFGSSNVITSFNLDGTPNYFNPGNQTVKEFTLTHKTMLTSSLGNRIEYRHDWSNEAYFERQDGSSVRNQNTISTDFFVTF